MNLSIDNVIVQLRIINYEILSSKLEIVSSKQYKQNQIAFLLSDAASEQAQ